MAHYSTIYNMIMSIVCLQVNSHVNVELITNVISIIVCMKNPFFIIEQPHNNSVKLCFLQEGFLSLNVLSSIILVWVSVAMSYNSLSHKKSHNSSGFWKRGLSCSTRFNCKKKNNTIILATMKRTRKSLGKECAVFGCSTRSYSFVNKERKQTGISLF